MKICMVLYDMQEFGGLEEYASTQAISLQQLGHQVSILSSAWITPDNQYLKLLKKNNIIVVQLPKWISLPASDWLTKEKMLAIVMRLASPVIYLLAGALFLLKRRSWQQSFVSARGRLHGILLDRLIGPDRRKPFTRLLLDWWRIRWHPDLLHIQGYTTNLLFVIDWAYKKVPVVYEEHQTPDSQFDWWRNFQQTINKSAVVVAVSEKSAEALCTLCGVTQPIFVRGPLVQDPVALGWQKVAKPRECDDPISITTAARLYVTKGLRYLLEAIVQVKKIHPKTQFRVYGDGPLHQELLAYADQLGLDGSQIFVGTFIRDELAHIMAQTDIFVMSSILEGQPLAVVEAMAYGCPIVTTSVGGIPEMIDDGINGLLCEPRDPEGLANKIRTLIEDPDLRLKLGQAARKSYEQGPFQPESACKQFVSIYEEVLQKSTSKKNRFNGKLSGR
jgi:glycosyltransferase involved in cell wall biosynthesis